MSRHHDAWETDREGPSRTISVGPVPIGLTLCTERIVRLRIGGGAPGPEARHVPPREWPGATFTEEAGPPARIDTDGLVLRVAADPVGVTFSDPLGRARATLTDVRGAAGVRLRLQLADVQHFFGLGEGGQQFDRLGTARRFWNNHANHGHAADVPVPVLVSHLGWGLFFDNTGPAEIAVGGGDGGRWLEYRCDLGPVDLYYLAGADLREAVAGVAQLLGHPPMPPRWALGYLQSTRHFDSPDELRRLPQTIRERRLPCDGLIFLSTYGDALGWNRGVGHLECEPRLLGDAAALFGELRARHFHTVTHEYPVLHPESPVYPEASERGYVLDAGYARETPAARPTDNYREGQRYLDFSRPDARAWWWQQHRPLVALGVDGWWLDGGEGPPADVELYAGSSRALHNRYDVLRQQAFADGEAADRPDHRVFLLCRSGGAGMQRWGAACWSGDIDATFPSLEAQPAIGLNTGLSGVPYWGTDVGGFYRVAPNSEELFVRWFQFGAFCPIFRAHGRVWREHLPWAHSADAEAICRRYLDLRYRLLPYTYTLAWQAHRHGLPLMRPLVLNYPEDARVWNLSSEYLWGDDLLVAPVTREGATRWPVYLPAGGWYDFWTHERYEGPRGVEVAAPRDRLPLFVRAGAILPFAPALQYQDERPLEDVTLRIYPHGRSSFTLYEDDGASHAYRRGRYALTAIECVSTPDACTVSIAAPAGDPDEVPPARVYTIELHARARPRRVRLAGTGDLPERPRGDSGWRYTRGRVRVRVPSQRAVVDVEW
jgi:alpha-glucosidase (family GH31 glycosyl hydrolase)